MKTIKKWDEFNEGINLNSVYVKFENPKYNYETSVSSSSTKDSVEQYFVGQYFDMGVYPSEDMQKVVGVDFQDHNIEAVEHGVKEALSGYDKGIGNEDLGNKINDIISNYVEIGDVKYTDDVEITSDSIEQASKKIILLLQVENIIK